MIGKQDSIAKQDSYFVLRWQKQTKAHNPIHSIEQSIEKQNDETIIPTTIITAECLQILKPSVKYEKQFIENENNNGNENKGQHNTKQNMKYFISNIKRKPKALNNEQQ